MFLAMGPGFAMIILGAFVVKVNYLSYELSYDRKYYILLMQTEFYGHSFSNFRVEEL